VANEPSTKEAADSTLVWGALGMILGSPAPTAAQTETKRKSIELWQGNEDCDVLPEDLADIVLATSYDESDDCSVPFSDDCSVPSVTSRADEATIDTTDDMPNMIEGLDEEIPPPPPEVTQKSISRDADSALAWTALSAILGSPAPQSVAKRRTSSRRTSLFESEDGPDMLPEIDDDEDGAIDMGELVDGEETDNVKHVEAPTSSEEGAESVLAWSALGALLGSPAPASVSRASVSRLSLNLWDDGEDSDALPEIEEESVACEEGEIDLAELGDEHGDAVGGSLLEPEVNGSEGADSVLAWSALGMFLGSPAPSSVSTKLMPKEMNLWEDGEASDDLPEINEDECPINESKDESEHHTFTIDLDELVEGSDEGDNIHEDPIMPEVNSKEGADSVLAWSALSMFLGSPAPQAVSKKSYKRSNSKGLWDDGIPIDSPMPPLAGTFDSADNDDMSIPSLAGTSDRSDEINPGSSPITVAGMFLADRSSTKNALPPIPR
jgi:hypothetical protein